MNKKNNLDHIRTLHITIRVHSRPGACTDYPGQGKRCEFGDAAAGGYGDRNGQGTDTWNYHQNGWDLPVGASSCRYSN
ncbi:MAG: hypothetical protein WD097_03985 [Balneolales bacterium]